MPDNDAVHVALAFRDPEGTYARHAAVTMASVFANCGGAATVHVLHDETLTRANRDALTQLADGFAQSVTFRDAGERFRALGLNARNMAFQGFRGTMYRLFIPDLIGVAKVVYLDCDIVVNADIRDLWTQDLRGRALGAVRDVYALDLLKGRKISWRLKKFWTLLDIAPENYFNAGVLVMDLDKIRAGYSLLDAAIDFFDEYGRLAPLPDQDFLNSLFARDTTLLDERFNRIDASPADEAATRGSIWHMAGGSAKPWNSYTRPFVDDLYWRYLRLTPYCASDDELLSCALRGLSASPLTHLHSSDCVRRLLGQLADDIFRAHVWTVPPILWKCLKKRFARSRSRGGAR